MLRAESLGIGKSIIEPPSNQTVFAILLVVAIGWCIEVQEGCQRLNLVA